MCHSLLFHLLALPSPPSPLPHTHTHTQQHNYNKQIQSRLHQLQVTCDLKALSLGDMTWIARRHRRQPGPRSLVEAAAAGKGKKRSAKAKEREEEAAGEVMLRFLVERKTNRDLAASIMDGRYTEQKGRMLGAGNEVDRALYLVEGALHHQDAVPPATLRTAVANTQVLHGLQVLMTENLDQTIALLARLHRRIAHAFDHFLHAARAGPGSAARQAYLHTRCVMEGVVAVQPTGHTHFRSPFSPTQIRPTTTTTTTTTTNRLPSLPLPPSRVIPFSEYQARCRKSGGAEGLDVSAVFTRQLRQLPKFGPQQVQAVMGQYPTPARCVPSGLGKRPRTGTGRGRRIGSAYTPRTALVSAMSTRDLLHIAHILPSTRNSLAAALKGMTEDEAVKTLQVLRLPQSSRTLGTVSAKTLVAVYK
jgi:ERCC4-type nuclease